MAWGKPVLLIFFLALLAYGLWFAEIHFFIGWDGMEWLPYSHYSVFGIAALVVAAYLAPFWMLRSASMSRLAKAGIELYFVVLAAYFLEKLILLTLFTQFYGFLDQDWLLLLQVLVLAMTVLSFYFITQRWLEPLRWQQLLVFAAAIILPYPLSLLSLRFLFHFGAGFGFTESFKIGYPFFWIVLLLGIAGIIATQNFKKPIQQTLQEDILDDLGEED